MKVPIRDERMVYGIVRNMHVIMSTENISKEKKFSYWKEFVCDYYMQADCFPTSNKTFNAKISEARIGNITLSKGWAGGQTSSNVNCLNFQTNKKSVFILQQLYGKSMFSRKDRVVKLGSKDIVCFDSTTPFSHYSKDEYGHLLIHLPYDLWAKRFGHIEPMAMRVVRNTSAMGTLAGMYFHHISLLSKSIDAITAARIEDATFSLVSAVLGSLLSVQELTQNDCRTALMYQVKAFITKYLNDPDLDRKKIAAFFDISETYLTSLFSDENQSVDKWIWDMRLKKCRRDISNPLFSGKSLSEIAFNSGFNSLSHFSRKFKEAFKMTASEYRRMQGL